MMKEINGEDLKKLMDKWTEKRNELLKQNEKKCVLHILTFQKDILQLFGIEVGFYDLPEDVL